jgi:F0F1-type ATP synthase membrane subunit b/b'
LEFGYLYILVSYYRRLGKLKDIERTAYTKANEVLSQMEKTSATILEKVESRADEILTHSELFKKDLNQAFEHSLEESSQKYVVMLEDHSKRFVDDYEILLKSVKDQSLEKASKAIDTIDDDIRKSLEDSKVVARDQMGVFLKKALEEVETFKKQELEKIDKEIDEFVLQLAKELLRMNLTPKDHKKLIINSLEKAKEQGMFFL